MGGVASKTDLQNQAANIQANYLSKSDASSTYQNKPPTGDQYPLKSYTDATYQPKSLMSNYALQTALNSQTTDMQTNYLKNPPTGDRYTLKSYTDSTFQTKGDFATNTQLANQKTYGDTTYATQTALANQKTYGDTTYQAKALMSSYQPIPPTGDQYALQSALNAQKTYGDNTYQPKSLMSNYATQTDLANQKTYGDNVYQPKATAMNFNQNPSGYTIKGNDVSGNNYFTISNANGTTSWNGATLTFGNPVIVNNTLTATTSNTTGNSTVGGNQTVGGTIQSGNLKLTNGWTNFAAGNNNSEISNDTGSIKTLMIVGNASGGAGRKVGIWDDLTVNRNSTVNGSQNIGGSLNIGGDTVVNGAIAPLGGVNMIDRSIRLRGGGDTNHILQYAGDVDGPELRGNAGGKLTTSNGKIALKWDNNGNVNTVGNQTVGGNLNVSGSITGTKTCWEGSEYIGYGDGSWNSAWCNEGESLQGIKIDYSGYERNMIFRCCK